MEMGKHAKWRKSGLDGEGLEREQARQVKGWQCRVKPVTECYFYTVTFNLVDRNGALTFSWPEE